MHDDLGNIHNVMDVSQYENYDLLAPEERDIAKPYGQETPDFSE